MVFLKLKSSLKISPCALNHVRHAQDTAYSCLISSNRPVNHRWPLTFPPVPLHLPFKPSHLSSAIATSQLTPWKCQSLACIPSAPSWTLFSVLFLLPTRHVGLICVKCSGNPRGSNPHSKLLQRSCVSFLHSAPLLQSLSLFLYLAFLDMSSCLSGSVCLISGAWHPEYAGNQHGDLAIVYVIHVSGPPGGSRGADRLPLPNLRCVEDKHLV